MTILFAGGDVGGVRALLPVCAVCARRGMPFWALDHRFLAAELPAEWRQRLVPPTDDLATLLTDKGVRAVAFASSVKDGLPLRMARAAKAVGRGAVHLLDHWSDYRERLCSDGGPPLAVDVYAVMDAIALRAARDAGIPGESLRITGQPALASLADFAQTTGGAPRAERLSAAGLDAGRRQLLFVSEPVRRDHGGSAANPRYRGYTEQSALALLSAALQPFAEQIQLLLLPHPRQPGEEVAALWESCRGRVEGSVVATSGRDALALADGVVGMASMLLYEAWLLGLPVLSLQPGLRRSSLRRLEQCAGVVFIDRAERVSEKIGAWLMSVQYLEKFSPRSDLALHQHAPERVADVLEAVLNQPVNVR